MITIAACAIVAAFATPALAATQAAPLPQVRVNQVGYPPGRRRGLCDAAAQGRGRAVQGHVRRTASSTGARPPTTWERGTRPTGRCTAQLLGVQRPGSTGSSPGPPSPPLFIVGDGTQLYRQLVDNAVRYFTSERDGPDVDSSVLNRQPANLTDEKAYVYAAPHMTATTTCSVG